MVNRPVGKLSQFLFFHEKNGDGLLSHTPCEIDPYVLQYWKARVDEPNGNLIRTTDYDLHSAAPDMTLSFPALYVCTAIP
jgi:hypothetical protein